MTPIALEAPTRRSHKEREPLSPAALSSALRELLASQRVLFGLPAWFRHVCSNGFGSSLTTRGLVISTILPLLMSFPHSPSFLPILLFPNSTVYVQPYLRPSHTRHCMLANEASSYSLPYSAPQIAENLGLTARGFGSSLTPFKRLERTFVRDLAERGENPHAPAGLRDDCGASTYPPNGPTPRDRSP